jgi:two-component system cell cycle response regulator
MTEAIDNKPTILVVDDSRLMRVAARKILKDDFDILEAGDGEQAWESLQQNPHINLIMSDLSMPNLDGLSLLKRIREAEKPDLKTLPVIIVTGAEDDDGSKQTALAAGASDFITKPFESVQLLARAKTQAEQQQTHQALQTSQADKQQLEQHSTVDILTGLANERDLINHIEEGLSYALRHRTELSLLLVQVVKYKVMFLRRGKQTAEEVLRHMARLLTEGRRREDNVARISLDTFGILLPSANPIGARRVAEQLLDVIRSHCFEVNGEPIPVTANIAVVSPPITTGTNAIALLDEAKEKLRLAQEAGGDRIQSETADNTGSAAPSMPTQQPPAQPQNKVTPVVASATDVEKALQALASDRRPEADATLLVRAVMPLLHAWNQAHNNQYATLLEALTTALEDKDTEPLRAPADAV